MGIFGDKEYWVEILNDDRTHGIIVGEFERWQMAVEMYERLIRGRPQMRVVMRHVAHIYRNYIPDRLHNSYDRSQEYPM